MNPDINIEGDLVIKKYSMEVDKEYDKAKVLCDIAMGNGFFSVEPLTLKATENKISFKYLYATGSVRDLYREYLKKGDNKELMLNVTFEAGKILGNIHNNLILKTKKTWFPPQKFIDALVELGCPSKEDLLINLPQAFLHCDYGITNIQYLEQDDSITIVVYDSSPNNYYTKYTDSYGPIYVDIGCFISGINGLVPIYDYPFIDWDKINEVKHSFVSGYESYKGCKLIPYYVDLFSYGCANCYFSHKYKSSLLQYLAMKALFNRKKSNFPISA
ncbi:MAG: hypothetical protein O7D86_13995 [Proteobacteria bacterium]|nr:hypothetical protein [Pseudomonadota bacterium]